MKPLKNIMNRYMYKSSLISAAVIMALLFVVQIITEQLMHSAVILLDADEKMYADKQKRKAARR